MITAADLKAICPLSKVATLEKFVDPLNAAMLEFDIDTPEREAMFLAQIAHESGGFRYVRELASGADYDTGKKAIALGNTPEDDDDGERYKGRGLIQITGRSNYRACGDALAADLLNHPELLEGSELACRSAAWFWQTHGLNELADKGDFLKITKRINGGTTHYAERRAYLVRAQNVLSS